ncbi:hypothetical protein BESB_036870 [Besnoitia besnoiti]|uniref:Signal recognition particle domain-containing protein n=1 Tax=Besnoitia besnoiti TaxID=94643 RepID=A0A2A9MH48_BESBE|nr:hypothetical protein BESB_036870 [Besnoitia besnoiti]PFH37229.1 hypothetical protein BESB_036870 [Besnoitia besnoiti]
MARAAKTLQLRANGLCAALRQANPAREEILTGYRRLGGSRLRVESHTQPQPLPAAARQLGGAHQLCRHWERPTCGASALCSSGACFDVSARSFSTRRGNLLGLDELERRLETGEAAPGFSQGGYDRRFEGAVVAATADVLLVRGLGAASVGSLVAFDGDASAASSFHLGVVLQLLDQDLTLVGLLGDCMRALPAPAAAPSAPGCAVSRAPLVGDVCRLFVGDSCGGVSEKDRKQITLPLLRHAPLSLLSTLASGNTPSQDAADAATASDAAREPQEFWNLFSLPARGTAPSQPRGSAATALLPTGSVVLDALSPLQLGASGAVVGPVGTGKSTSLLPLVASHLVSSSSPLAKASPAAITAAAASVRSSLSAAAAGLASPSETERALRLPPPSVIFLSLRASPLSALERWLDTLTSVAIPSATASMSLLGAAAAKAVRAAPWWRAGDEESKRATADEFAKLGREAAVTAAAQGLARGAGGRKSDEQPCVPPGLLFLYAHPEMQQMPCCIYTAPMLALKAALASQAAGQNVLLVIDGLDAHAAATEQLKQNVKNLLASPSARAVLPAAGASRKSQAVGRGVSTPGGVSVADAAEAGALPVLPFASLSSYYGQLVSQTGATAGEKNSSLSLLCVLDTPPGVCTPGSAAAAGVGADLTKQERQWSRVLSSTIHGDTSLGEATLRKAVEVAQEALISSVDKTVVFNPDAQLERQSMHQLNKGRRIYSGRQACAEATADARRKLDEESSLRASSGAKRKSGGGVGSFYPMVDVEFLLSSSPALLSADACAALSASCFSPSLQENPPPPEVLFEALKDLCHKHASCAKSGIQETGAAEREISGLPGVDSSAYDPSPLLSAAASAFAWQQKVLRSQTERQEMMAALKLFVDVWEEEELVSLRIASGVCTAQRAGRSFSAAEQVVLLRAAATLLFAPPTGEERAKEREREKSLSSAARVAAEAAGLALCKKPWFVGQDTGLVSFEDLCAFQEDLFGLFRELHPQVWKTLCRYLAQHEAQRRARKELAEPRAAGEAAAQERSVMVRDAALDCHLNERVKELLQLIGAIDRALLDLRPMLALTRPAFDA